jgi:hypothetical protein
MEITLDLSEILDRCNDWEEFCDEQGWSVWCVNEGGGDIEVSLTEEEAISYGIIRDIK